MTKTIPYSALEDVVLLRIIVRLGAHLISANDTSAQPISIALPQAVMEMISKVFENEVCDKVSPRPRRSSISLHTRYVQLLEHYASNTLPQDDNKEHSLERETLLKLIIQEHAALYVSEDNESSPPFDPDESIHGGAKDPIDVARSSPQATNTDRIRMQSERQREVLLELAASNEKEHLEFMSKYSDILLRTDTQQEAELQELEKKHLVRIQYFQKEINAWKKKLMLFDVEHVKELRKIHEQREQLRQQLLEK